MSMDLTGITNKNDYYTRHYFSTVFEENAGATINRWSNAAKESEEVRTPWAMLRQSARQFYTAHDRYVRSSLNLQALDSIRKQADLYLNALGYPAAKPAQIVVDDTLTVPVYLEMTKSNGAPLLWVILAASAEEDTGVMESHCYDAAQVEEDAVGAVLKGLLSEAPNEEMVTRVLFGAAEPPRFLLLIGMNQIALIDRNKWNEKRYLQFELEEIFSRLENSTLQAMSVLLHRESLCPEDGKVLLDELDEQSQKNASGVSQDLKYALRESVEILGNEVLYDMETRLGRDLEANPVDAGQLTLECLRYMYRMLFVLFIEARPKLGYVTIDEQSYFSGYSLESLRDIADNIRDDVEEVGNGYYLHETLSKLYELIYDGYPKTEQEMRAVAGAESLHDVFLIAPLKAHIFDPEYTRMITAAKLRNRCLLRIIDLMSLTRTSTRKNSRRQRISYANLGINQMGAVYEALLSYRGFIAEQDLYEVKREGDSFNELDVGYFVPESELDQYTEAERVRYESGENKGKLRMYKKGAFIYRLAGREREKSASYYTPEVLTKCLVKYALKELLEGKTADEILELTVCEPAMGSAAFLNEAINQLAEAYISRKEQETGEIIHYKKRPQELQKVKMYIADRNVYGIDLNPVAVELAEVSLWLNTIYTGGYVPWFGTQLINGNSLIGARRQVYSEAALMAKSKGLRWYENAPDRVPVGTDRRKRRSGAQIYHFLLGDPGMCDYTDKVIKSLEPDNIKRMKAWNKGFVAPYTTDEIETLKGLCKTIDRLWKNQVEMRKQVRRATRDSLSIYGHVDTEPDSRTSIREKDRILRQLYKTEHAQNAGAYARLKFAMDYWCALWFWPIQKAELLPSRSEFLNDMYMILVGLMPTSGNRSAQTSMFGEEAEEAADALEMVDLDNLCALLPRLALVRQIAEQNHFMHWELEFADLFAERGGFDLVLGNPPWILLEWNEKSVLSEKNPSFAVKDLDASTVARKRVNELADDKTCRAYLDEYVSITGQQLFFNANENYIELAGMKANLYKCFLPQAWRFCSKQGVSAFVHPDGVYDDPKGGELRKLLYPKLRKHFQFENELNLFEGTNDHGRMRFAVNIYSNVMTDKFDTIANLFSPSTVDQCYGTSSKCDIPGIKDENGNWNVCGHPGRVVHVGEEELKLFAKLFDESENWQEARLPMLHAQAFLEALKAFAFQQYTIANIPDNEIAYSVMFFEAADSKKGIIERNVHFPDSPIDAIISGPHIGVANPRAKTSRRICKSNGDYDSIDLTKIGNDYTARCNYKMLCDPKRYTDAIIDIPWGGKYHTAYRIGMRKMLNLSGERTLIAAVIPPGVCHIDGIYSMTFSSGMDVMAGCMASLPYDFYIKISGKANGCYNVFSSFPVLAQSKFASEIALRALVLNCITSDYAEFWRNCWNENFLKVKWTKEDTRLTALESKRLNGTWNWKTPLRGDYERRQALVELDVVVAMALGINLSQLLAIYRIQFPVLQQNESDTWYDANGRIVFTNNRSLVGVGFDRKIFELEMKDAPAGKKFYRTITDDTMPGGPVERTIEYVAPFDRCDREQDYETAWKFFEEKYGKQES